MMDLRPRRGALGKDAKGRLENTPLANLLWRTSSGYLRDESCRLPGQTTSAAQDPTDAAAPHATPPGPICAVILTSFDILRRGSASADATPEDYRHNGLRTSGTWTVSPQIIN